MKEDVWVTASNGVRVLIEMLDEYEKSLIESEGSDTSPQKFNKLQENTDF